MQQSAQLNKILKDVIYFLELVNKLLAEAEVLKRDLRANNLKYQ